MALPISSVRVCVRVCTYIQNWCSKCLTTYVCGTLWKMQFQQQPHKDDSEVAVVSTLARNQMEADALSPPPVVKGSLGLLRPLKHSRCRPVCGSHRELDGRLAGNPLQCLSLVLWGHGSQRSLGRAEGKVYFEFLPNSTELFQYFNKLSLWSITPKYHFTLA